MSRDRRRDLPGWDAQISPNFRAYEFRCRHCGTGTPDPALVAAAQALRDLIGAFTPTSACRCEAWNAAVGGVPNSQHLCDDENGLMGRAIDIAPPLGWTVLDLFEAVLQVDDFREGGIGVYLPGRGNFVHADIRGEHMRWLEL